MSKSDVLNEGVLPIIWHKKLVHTAKVDLTLLDVLSFRDWHISNLNRPSAPRTSLFTSKGTKHLLLHRAVACLSKLTPAQRFYFWEDLDLTWNYCSQFPTIQFRDKNPFNCKLDNLVFMAHQTPVSATDVVLPRSAIEVVERPVLSPEDGKFLSSEVVKTGKVPSLDEILNLGSHEIDSENSQTIQDVFGILRDGDTSGERDSSSSKDF